MAKKKTGRIHQQCEKYLLYFPGVHRTQALQAILLEPKLAFSKHSSVLALCGISVDTHDTLTHQVLFIKQMLFT